MTVETCQSCLKRCVRTVRPSRPDRPRPGKFIDEFEKTLNAWILKKANGVQIEQNKVDAAKAEVEKAINALIQWIS